MEPVEDVSKVTLQDLLRGKVTMSSTVYSDPWKSYNGLKEPFEGHQMMDHGANEYAWENVTINGIEGLWAFADEELRKHHGVDSEHFENFLKEKAFRWNDRFLNQETFVDNHVEILATRFNGEPTC